ncbi:MAG: type I-C CRISPR-associated protein Cas7/Csd2 [Roseiflexaceae bacterium]|nr:type I-C CRISPR-associated protein Cas7/Csd2 [Roseiflexaceae bacterium]
MSNELIIDPTRRHDFVLLFDVADGNPNGDPDAGNLPRVDPETMQGLVTDVAIKRKIRDYVDLARGTEQRFKIYVQHEAYLTDTRNRVFGTRAPGQKNVPVNDGRAWMCEEFFDVRMFGAVMSMKESNAGQVRGPMQLTFARSIDPIVPLDLSIVGPAQNQAQSKRAEGDETDKFGTMGRKAIVPYGLYRAHGFFNPHFAKQTGAIAEDLEIFWKALEMMWDTDRSASRGMMSCRGLYIFTHASSLGDAPAHKLLERVKVAANTGVTAPRAFSNYRITIEDAGMPEKVTLTRLVEG